MLIIASNNSIALRLIKSIIETFEKEFVKQIDLIQIARKLIYTNCNWFTWRRKKIKNLLKKTTSFELLIIADNEVFFSAWLKIKTPKSHYDIAEDVGKCLYRNFFAESSNIIPLRSSQHLNSKQFKWNA